MNSTLWNSNTFSWPSGQPSSCSPNDRRRSTIQADMSRGSGITSAAASMFYTPSRTDVGCSTNLEDWAYSTSYCQQFPLQMQPRRFAQTKYQRNEPTASSCSSDLKHHSHVHPTNHAYRTVSLSRLSALRGDSMLYKPMRYCTNLK